MLRQRIGSPGQCRQFRHVLWRAVRRIGNIFVTRMTESAAIAQSASGGRCARMSRCPRDRLRLGEGAVQWAHMKLYRIENGVKMPPVTYRNGGKTVMSAVAATLLQLNKGQSFLIKDQLEVVKAGKIISDANRRERTRGGKRAFSSRKIGGNLRIWRVK